VGVLFCDLDRFKFVNDSYGHAAGDELLAEVADRLRDVVRDGDTVARIGGDEFVILCEELADRTEVESIAKRVMHALDTPFALNAGHLAIGASIGIALADEDSDPDALIANADVAVFYAKDQGRARVVHFSPEMHAETQTRRAAERELRDAIVSGAIQPYFQPIVDVGSGEVRGFEAFARWVHPTRGVLSPGDFLPMAEETGLVVELGAHILDAACAHLAEWCARRPDVPAPFVGVTCSARQLVLPDLPDIIAGAVERHGIAPELVCMEITESALTYDAETAVERLQRIRASGVRIAIDDFGVDHSSIAYLKRFPVDLVKLDTSFITDLGSDSGGSTIVAAVIALAHALGLGVVAEGVETIEQLAALYTLGCDQAQGYLFSPPLQPDEAQDLLGQPLGLT
jgi:diguanylate cyclase (GGDEF)-like protein